MTAKEESERLKQEAKRKLLKILNIPDGYSSGLVDRFVDCIISATVLEVASIIQEAAQQSAEDDGDHSDPRLWGSNNTKRRK